MTPRPDALRRNDVRQLDKAAIGNLLRVAKAHRQHERFYAMEGLEAAAGLRRDANALRALADRWLDAPTAAASAIDDPRFRAAGCTDLNADAATASAGILFMEGENEPAELAALKHKLSGFAARHAEISKWLLDMMERAWDREAILLKRGTATAGFRRHLTVTRTALTAGKLGIAGRLAAAAHTALSAQDFRPAAIRADRRGAAEIVRTAAWLLDAATAVLAEQASQLGNSDADWTAYIEELEHLGETDATQSSDRDSSAEPRPRSKAQLKAAGAASGSDARD
jgi:hypothetical protein